MPSITTDVSQIVHELAMGRVVALPTETVYGLAADATCPEAVERIFKIKNRPLNHPLIMHVAPDWDLSAWVERIPNYVPRLMAEFWPGPLTFVFRLKQGASLTPSVTGHQNTIAIRAPAHPQALEVLRQFGRPLVAPSANPFGKISPTEALHVSSDFPEHDFLILDGGSCRVGIESTILYCAEDDACRIVRSGMVSQALLSSHCDVLKLGHHAMPSIRVSGNLKSHYQPKKPLFYGSLVDAEFVRSAWLDATQYYTLCFSLLLDKPTSHHHHRFSDDPLQAANAFYRQLRLADQSSQKAILIELPPDAPEWDALRDRIKKAGSEWTMALRAVISC